eukprot:1134728-Rhodomonas_salina.1
MGEWGGAIAERRRARAVGADERCGGCRDVDGAAEQDERQAKVKGWLRRKEARGRREREREGERGGKRCSLSLPLSSSADLASNFDTRTHGGEGVGPGTGLVCSPVRSVSELHWHPTDRGATLLSTAGMQTISMMMVTMPASALGGMPPPRPAEPEWWTT